MFTTGHQQVSVTAFCEAGRAWSLPQHSGMARQELCLAIPDPERCLPCPSRAGPHDLRPLITSIPLSKPDLIPQPPHSSLRGGLGLQSPQIKIEQKCFQTHSKNFRV